MWIAFKNYYLRDEGQLVVSSPWIRRGCELLSKIIIFVMKDNEGGLMMRSIQVVNCFQKLLSSWWRTTTAESLRKFEELWIAFKNYYLRDEGQHVAWKKTKLYSCELLSKIIIFVMKDNWVRFMIHRCEVVNCFQKLLSSWWRTTF